MPLEGFYEFLELSHSDGLVIARARDLKTGKLVQVHMFPGEKAAEAREICDLLPALPIPELAKILKYGKDGGWTYLTTEPLQPGDDVRSWIRRTAKSSVRTAAPPPAEERTTAPAEEKRMGEFTRLYSREELVSKARPDEPPPTNPAPSAGTGEFTELYGKSDWTAVNRPRPAPEQATPASASTVKGGASAPPGLNTFIGLSTAAAASRAEEPVPAREPPQSPADTTPPFDLHPPVPPDLGLPAAQPQRDDPVPAPVRRANAPPRKPAPRPARASLFDWRVFLASGGILVAVLAFVLLALG